MALRSHGEKVFASPVYDDEDDTCEWCDEESDELYEVKFEGE